MKFATVFLLALAACKSMSPIYQTGFLDRTIRLGSTDYRYVVFVPADYDARTKWPVILFLHGSGERGSDGLKQSEVGLGRAIRMNPERFSQVIAVFPQAPEETGWLREPAQAAIAALDRTITEFNGDRDRQYLTGMSMGGYGSWYLAIEEPTRFAAVVPVCGGIVRPGPTVSVQTLPLAEGAADPYLTAAAALPRIPFWVFHGAKDQAIPVEESRKMVDELKKLGADVRYTEYPEVGHNSWDPAYSEDELWKWLFAQRRR